MSSYGFRSEMRGPALIGIHAIKLYVKVSAGQPLLLLREPFNPVDHNAIICCDMMGQPMGYVAREDAAVIAPEIDSGYLWRGKVEEPPVIKRNRIKRHCQIWLWREEGGSMRAIMALSKQKEEVE